MLGVRATSGTGKSRASTTNEIAKQMRLMVCWSCSNESVADTIWRYSPFTWPRNHSTPLPTSRNVEFWMECQASQCRTAATMIFEYANWSKYERNKVHNVMEFGMQGRTAFSWGSVEGGPVVVVVVGGSRPRRPVEDKVQPSGLLAVATNAA